MVTETRSNGTAGPRKPRRIKKRTCKRCGARRPERHFYDPSDVWCYLCVREINDMSFLPKKR